MLEIPARDALNILNLYEYFDRKVSKKRLVEIWKENREKSFDQLKAIIQKELGKAA